MRRNYAAYSIFYTTFVSAIVGKRLFRKRIKNVSKDKEIATISDEALALLGLENGEARWDAIWESSNGKIRIVPKGDAIPETWKSTVLTKYTGTSRTDPTILRDTDDKRWSREGIERINKLRKLVWKD